MDGTETRSELEQLPLEIRYLIVEGLSVKEILEFCLSNKEMNTVCQDPALWRLLVKRDFGFSLRKELVLVYENNDPKSIYRRLSGGLRIGKVLKLEPILVMVYFTSGLEGYLKYGKMLYDRPKRKQIKKNFAVFYLSICTSEIGLLLLNRRLFRELWELLDAVNLVWMHTPRLSAESPLFSDFFETLLRRDGGKHFLMFAPNIDELFKSFDTYLAGTRSDKKRRKIWEEIYGLIDDDEIESKTVLTSDEFSNFRRYVDPLLERYLEN
jgi:hypothetical protein